MLKLEDGNQQLVPRAIRRFAPRLHSPEQVHDCREDGKWHRYEETVCRVSRHREDIHHQ